MAGDSDSKFIWMDGKLIPFDQAQVHVLSHSLHYGSAAFEGIRAYQTKDGRTAIFRAVEHMHRFERSTRIFGGSLPYSSEELILAMRELIKANGFSSCYLRPLSYIGNETRGLKLPREPKMRVALATWQWGKYLGTDAINSGIKVCVASFRRPDVASALPWAKLSGNYLNSIMARREASLNGYDEAILLDHQGFVSEGSGENIFIVQGGELLTPLAGGVLLGITRDCVFAFAKKLGLTVKEQSMTRNQLYEADEVFFTGTAAEITPITNIDGHRIGTGKPGATTLTLAKLFDDSTTGVAKDFAHWLTYV